MKKGNEKVCWYCGEPKSNEDKCLKCGATFCKPPHLGPSCLGKEIELSYGKTRTPACANYEEFKMPSPAKQPGRKPLKGQPFLPTFKKDNSK